MKLFGERRIRSVWDDVAEEWYFPVVDVVAVLTESDNPRNYWKVFKNRLKKEGNQTVANCNQLKLRAEDGKMRLTDVATAEQMFRLIQSIPSRKAGSVWSVPVIDLFADSGLYPCEPAQAMFFHDAKTDMLHPNTDGQRRMALILQYRMLALPSDFKGCAKK